MTIVLRRDRLSQPIDAQILNSECNMFFYYAEIGVAEWDRIHHDRCEISKQTRILVNAMISHLVAVSRESKMLLCPRVWFLTVLVGDAMDAANIASQQGEEKVVVVGSLSSVARTSLSLALPYAKCQVIYKVEPPGAFRLSTLFLTALDWLHKDHGLNISGIKDLECEWVDE
ncbi:hypothetical protein BJX76DRAFT_359704 [Aspergillus varians]